MKKMVFGLMLVLLLNSCWLLPTNPEAEIEEMMLILQDVTNRQANAAEVKVDAAEFSGETSGSGSRAIYTETEDILRDDGIWVHVERVLDDKDTVTTEDDVLTVTRTVEASDGYEWTEILVRPLRPELTWSGWDVENKLVQTAKSERFLEGVKFAEVNYTVTWENNGTEIYLLELEREKTKVDRTTSLVRTVTSYDPVTELKSTVIYRIRLSGSDEVIVEEYTVEQVELSDGSIEERIVRDDGAYMTVEKDGSSVIRRFYSAEEVLRRKDVEVRTGSGIDIYTVFFNEDGDVVGERNTDLKYYVDGDTIVLKRTVNDRTTVSRVTPTENGYILEKNGREIEVVIDGNVFEFYGANGDFIGAAEILEDGTVVVY
jgi:hypothetical protein